MSEHAKTIVKAIKERCKNPVVKDEKFYVVGFKEGPPLPVMRVREGDKVLFESDSYKKAIEHSLLLQGIRYNGNDNKSKIVQL